MVVLGLIGGRWILLLGTLAGVLVFVEVIILAVPIKKIFLYLTPRLEVIHDKIPNCSMATQTHDDIFRSFDYLHIK